jgi:DNA-binding YbaB/EbfC family protein
MMNQARLMAQVKKMQAEMQRAQDELAETVVTGRSAGAQVEMTCDHRVRRVTLVREAIDPDDPETLEDLLVVAINDALEKVAEASRERMARVTGGLQIPGIS